MIDFLNLFFYVFCVILGLSAPHLGNRDLLPLLWSNLKRYLTDHLHPILPILKSNVRIYRRKVIGLDLSLIHI